MRKIQEIPITDTLDLHTIPARDVDVCVEEYLFQCHKKKFRFIRIIHGKGIGVQRERVRSILALSKYVESYTDGPDWGSTAVFLKA